MGPSYPQGTTERSWWLRARGHWMGFPGAVSHRVIIPVAVPVSPVLFVHNNKLQWQILKGLRGMICNLRMLGSLQLDLTIQTCSVVFSVWKTLYNNTSNWNTSFSSSDQLQKSLWACSNTFSTLKWRSCRIPECQWTPSAQRHTGTQHSGVSSLSTANDWWLFGPWLKSIGYRGLEWTDDKDGPLLVNICHFDWQMSGTAPPKASVDVVEWNAC